MALPDLKVRVAYSMATPRKPKSQHKPRGGARPGSGPKKGSKNIRTKRRIAALAEAAALAEKVLGKGAFKGTAVELMTLAYKSEHLPMDVRLDIASKVAPYQSAKKLQVAGEGGGPIRFESLNESQLLAAAERIERALIEKGVIPPPAS